MSSPSENEIIYEVITDKKVGILRIKRHLHPTLFLQLWRKNLLMGFTFVRNDILMIKIGVGVGGRGEEVRLSSGTVVYDVAEESLGILLRDTGIQR